MDGIKIEVTGNIARVTEKPKRITSGTVGLPVDFTFDEQWDGLEKTAVFQAGQVCKIVSGLGASTTVPWEVLQNAHEWLSIGVYGENEDGSVAIPTIWANVKVIDVGTSPNGDSCKAPSKAEWTRMLIGQSAYELAVALGFPGSEEEWIDSLKGAEVELRCVDDMIQWRLQTEPEQEWRDLTNVAEFQQVAADAAKRAEEAAAKLEGGLVLRKGEGVDSIVQVITNPPGRPELDNKPYAKAEGSVVFGEYGVVHADNDEAGNGETSMAVNYQNQVYGARSFAANVFNKVFGKRSAAFGNGNWIGQGPTVDYPNYENIIPSAATVFGTNNHVLGDNAVGTGNLTHANGKNSMTGGFETGTEGEQSVALGQQSKAYGVNSLAGGRSSQTGEADKVGGTAGKESFAWGFNAQARGICSVAFGANTQSTGAYALSGGHGTKASNDYNFGYGKFILVNLPYQAAFGQYNDPTKGALFMIGNGTDENNLSNAFEAREDSIVVNGQEMTRENIASLLAHLLNKENPHGVTVAQLGIPELHACYLTIDPGRSVKFRIEGSSLVFGRSNGAASSCAAYVVAGYSHQRAPLITQLAAGSHIALSTGGNDNDLWYVELSNTNTGSTSIGVYIMGHGVPTFI